MKTFYTERDIVDMQAKGVIEIKIDDDVVLTDLAREKAIALGLRLKPAVRRSSQPNNLPRPAVVPQMPLPPAGGNPASLSPLSSAPQPSASEVDLVSQVKSAVIAQLGTTEYNDLLDQVIPQVLARLRK